jgi:CRISPR-associated endonuclease Cas1
MRRDPSKRSPAPRRRVPQASSAAPHPRPAEPSSSPIEVAAIPVRNGVVSLTGYGVRVSVHNGHLVLADGIGNRRREGRFSRATSGIKRLVIRGNAGFITFDALQWLNDVGAGYMQIGYDGGVVAAIGPRGLNDARLRRAQALAPWDGTGLDIMRNVLIDKMRGQAAVLVRISGAERARAIILAAVEEMGPATTLQGMRIIEGKAALAYWRSWEHVPVSWVRHDEPKVPDHWRSFGARMSPVSAKPRYAINPPNAILNYLYAVLEAETTLAIRAVGLDPGMGLLHVDEASRDSLTLDLMEVARPQVDAYVLDLLTGQPLAAAMFFETSNGVCRVMPRLAHTLTETGTLWLEAIASVVEEVAHTLHRVGQELPSVTPQVYRLEPAREVRALERGPATRLTRANRLASGAKQRAPVQPRACIQCGVVIESETKTRRRYCPDCTRLGRSETMRDVRAKMSARSLAERWGLRPEDVPDPDAFTREILPKLQSVVLSEIARVTGYSIAHASHIRHGRVVPDPRLWSALGRLVEAASRADCDR